MSERCDYGIRTKDGEQWRCESALTDPVEMSPGVFVRLCLKHRSWAPAMGMVSHE